jgi:hypothetical protein
LKIFQLKILKIALAVLILSPIVSSTSSSAQSTDCPDKWQIPVTVGNVSILEKDFQTNILSERISESAITALKSGLESDIKYLLISDFNYPVPEAYLQKIGSNNPSVVIQGAWKTSKDLKSWKGLVAIHPGNLLPYSELSINVVTPANIDRTSLAKRFGLDRFYPLSSASRFGITGGSYLSYEMKISAQGCKPFIVHERILKVPKYKIETQNLESLISNHYKANPSFTPINFVSLGECLKSFDQLVQNIKTASSKGANWQISNTSRGVLDLAWSPKNGENYSCWEGVARSSSFPFFDLSLNPSYGDSCFVRIDPYKSSYSYKTISTPCAVSIDSNGFEIAKFDIVPPTTGYIGEKRITCIKGNIKRQIIGLKPVCPKGFKQI